MKTALAVAALATLLALAQPVAAACPPEMADHEFPHCTEQPLIPSLGECVGFLFDRAHEYQVWAGETIACL